MKNLRLILALLFSGVLFLQAPAQIADLSKPIPADPAIKKGKLANGITYYIKQNKKPEQRMELRLAVNAGSVCETDNQLGLAHFVEHMCFNGTKNFPSNRIIDMLEEMGVKFGEELNAYTSFDETIYMLKVPTDKQEWIERGFQVLEDWAHQVNFDDAEIDAERGVIVEEWRLGLGANDRMMQKYLPVILKNSLYADRLPIGKIEIIKSFPYDTLRSFYKTWYRPDLMAVVVVGDIDPKLAEEKIREHFGRIQPAVKPKPRTEPEVPGNNEPLISVVTDKEASGSIVRVFFKHPAAKSVTYSDYRTNILGRIFTSMLGRRFQEIGQKPDAPFLYAGAGYGPFIGRTVDVYSLSASAKENQLEKSLEVILTENERIRRHGFTGSELEREKKNILTLYESMAKEADKTESEAYADEYVRNFLTEECIPGIAAEYDFVKQILPGITLDEINRLSREWTSDRNIFSLVTLPEKENIKVPDEKNILAMIESAGKIDVAAYTDDVSDAPLLADIPEPSPVIKRTENSDFGFTEITFQNGVRIILKPTDFKNDEILFQAFSPGGSSLYPDIDMPSITYATNIINQSGLGDFDMINLQKKLTGNTARLNPYISELREGVSGNCSPKDLETMLQLNYLYFTKIRKDENAFKTFISRMRNSYKPMRSVPQVIFSDTLSKIISMGSPRVIAIPSEKQLDQVNLDRLTEIFRERFADASDFTYIMTGNFKTDEVLPILEKYIGGLPSINRKETWRNVQPGFPAGLVKVDVPRNSEPQGLVAMVWRGDFKWKEKERRSYQMLMDILTIKCRESMREEQGGVYGVGINGSATKYPVPKYTISASWGCNPENIDKLSQTVIDEMNKLKSEGPTDTDISKVKETLIRDRESKMKENSFWMSAIQNHYYYGDRLMSLEEYRKSVESVKSKDIKAAAGRYFNTTAYVQVTLTPAQKN